MISSARSLCLLVAVLLWWSCGSGPGLPDIPLREELSLDVAVEKPYGILLANPQDPEANGDLAKLLHRLGQYSEAELLYQRAQLLDPESFRWPYYIGHVRVLAGSRDQAVSSFRQALAIDSEYLPAWLALGKAAFRSGDTINSSDAFERLGDEGAAGALGAYWKGRLALERRDWDGEVAILSRAVELAPEFGVAQYALGIRYKEMSRETQARNHLLLAQEYRLEKPQLEDPLLREVFGESYLPLDYVREGLELLANDRIPEAMTAFLQALTLGPDTIEAHAGLIQCYGRLGRVADAEDQFEEAVGINENYDQPYVRFGAVLLAQNRFQEAADQFSRALEANPYNGEALAYSGYLDEQNGDYDGAIRLYRRALEYHPAYAQVRVRLGAALLHEHMDSEAHQEFDRALEGTNARNPRLLYHISVAYSRSGNGATGDAYLARANDAAAEQGEPDLSWEEAERWPLE